MHQAGLVPALSVMMACTALPSIVLKRTVLLNTFLQERQVHLPWSSLSFLDTVAESGDPIFGSFIRR